MRSFRVDESVKQRDGSFVSLFTKSETKESSLCFNHSEREDHKQCITVSQNIMIF